MGLLESADADWGNVVAFKVNSPASEEALRQELKVVSNLGIGYRA